MSSNIFSKYNAGGYERVNWEYDTSGFKFFKLADMYAAGRKKLNCFGLFLTKGNYGLQAVAIGDDCFYNLPSHKVETVKKMINDEDCVMAIKRGRLALSLRQYTNKTGKICFDCDFIDKGVEEEASGVIPF